MGKRKKGRSVSGWLVLDKPYGMGSTQAVSKLRWLFDARKAGHAGTLDPLADGLLPIAFGEATKTVPYVTDGGKAYRFTVRFGTRTTTDDAEGEVLDTSDTRPDDDAIRAALPAFTGAVQQVPPAFSAIRINGARAYTQARAGNPQALDARTVEIDSYTLVDRPDADHAVFEVECGKGTYIRALARDLGTRMGCQGHVVSLRRTWVEPFEENHAIPLDRILALEGDHAALDALLTSPLDAMAGFETLRVSEAEATRLRLGNEIVLRGRDVPLAGDDVCAVHRGDLIAIGSVRQASFHPRRVLAAT